MPAKDDEMPLRLGGCTVDQIVPVKRQGVGWSGGRALMSIVVDCSEWPRVK